MTTPSDDLSDFVNEPSRPKKKPGRRFILIELLVVVAIIVVLIGLLLPATRSAGPAARRSQCVNNLKQIALGLHNYESVYKALPPAYTVDAAGKPLHSWRTLILPYLELGRIYETIDLTKPWNDPANAQALATPISTYRCPNLNFPANTTAYLAVVAPGGCFLPDRSRLLSEIRDSRAATLTVIEAASNQAVPWMAPIDADESLVLGLGPRSTLNHAGGMNGAFLDGSVRFLHANTPAVHRRAQISIAGDDDTAANALD